MSTSILIDTETLDTKPSSLVNEIAVIAFDRTSLQVVDWIVLHPDFFEQLALGRTFSADTIAFHRRNKTLPTLGLGTPLHLCLAYLTVFFAEHKPARVWIQGTCFDRPIIESMCDHFNMPLPWHFTKSADARTEWETAFPGVKHPKRPHKALEDCQATLADLIAALTKLNALPSI
jgi:hypothetical protein